MDFSRLLTLRAGADARRHLAEHALSAAHVRALTGAAGGPKWLVLSALDRYLFGDWLACSSQPIDLLGSSIGAWRFAAACHRRDPAGDDAARERAWRQAVDAGRVMRDAFAAFAECDQPPRFVAPL